MPWYISRNNAHPTVGIPVWFMYTFRPERDQSKDQSKLACVISVLAVNDPMSIGKKLVELDEDGRSSESSV